MLKRSKKPVGNPETNMLLQAAVTAAGTQWASAVRALGRAFPVVPNRHGATARPGILRYGPTSAKGGARGLTM
jgi:hypothetical protein